MSAGHIFQNFPCVPDDHKVTAYEHHGDLITVDEDMGQNTSRYSNYPDVFITKEAARALTEHENAKSAFLPHDETVWKRAIHAWYDMGLSGTLEEIVNSSEEVPPWTCQTAKRLLTFVRFANSLHGSLFPHLSLSNEDMITKFSNMTNWKTSPLRAFAWHPHTTKFAYAVCDDSIHVHMQGNELTPTLKHKLQKNVADLAWQPHYASVLAVACQSCILIWHVEPTSLATRPSSSSVQVLQQSNHCPVTCLAWDVNGRILLSSSPVDTAMMAWDVAMETCIQLRRVGGGGVSLLKWSPDGSKVLAATPSNIFRIWETSHWSCEKWSKCTGRCKAACWSPSGDVLLFTTEHEPIIYYLTFRGMADESKPLIGGSQAAVACLDLSEITVKTDSGDDVRAGGSIQDMIWDPTGERLAVLFKENRSGTNRYIAVFRTKIYPVLDITPCGFVKGFEGETPQHIAFQPKFDRGALLTVIWSSGRLSYIPMNFIPNDMVEYHKFQEHFGPINALLSPRLYSGSGNTDVIYS
ncbi:hypothetical protein ACJMK2_023499 [Sinanodonta woodiana]|uniref:Aladin seven-bladed propeller domain-containing protein n=1 Tax=Sinanodonta woodiana TaxID=1069815 RepID=A0ABD3T511_SINWO